MLIFDLRVQQNSKKMNWSTAIAQKIVTLSESRAVVPAWRFKDEMIGFTNGCFDLLHRGHYQYLAEARSQCDKLIIGLNSDASVRSLKGATRPIQDEQTRAFALASLAAVDLVIIFEAETPLVLIEALLPDVLMKGGDYEAEKIVGYQEVIQHGGRVLTLPFVDGYSTTNIEQRILAAHGK